MNSYDAWDKARAGDPPELLEVVTDVLYDTQKYVRGTTTELRFFQRAGVDPSLSNLLCPSMLPNPTSFLISEISLMGIPPVLAEGEFRLIVGAKSYARFPLRWFVMNARGSVLLHERVFIPPMLKFLADIRFTRVPKIYGPELDIVVCFTGASARPVS